MPPRTFPRRCTLARRSLAVALAVALPVACGTRSPGVPGPPALDAGSRAYDAVAYALEGRFDWNIRTLVATEDVTLALAAGASPIVELDAPARVTAVRAGERALGFASGGEKLVVDLGPLHPAGEVTFTVEYEVRASQRLRATTSVPLDPVQTRMVFTDSEPDGGHTWLVERDDPSDRARFSVALTVDADEDVVANGERVSDRLVAGRRRVAYAMSTPLPTYLMAFAAGQLVHADRTSASGVPLALWYRRGLVLDPRIAFGAVERSLEVFESLLGPFPFARYALVFAPEYAGMENATMTVEGELFAPVRWLETVHTHELAHSWFGDEVTMRRYEDVWVKEGMATLLAAELTRDRAAGGRPGELLGTAFSYFATDAIVDPTLHGRAKYTSGPYNRAAALVAQLRALAGEEAFWAHLRAFLAAHAGDSATGEQFLRSFAPDLPEATIEAAIATLPQFAVPVFTAVPSAVPGGTRVTIALDDPGHALLAPFEVTVVDAAGVAAVHALVPGSTLVLDVPDGGYLAPDERGVHAIVPLVRPVLAALAPLLTPPPGTPAWDTFLARSANHQEGALQAGGLPPVAPAGFPAFHAALRSDVAKLDALVLACVRMVAAADAERQAWLEVLAPIFEAGPPGPFGVAPLRCGPALGARVEPELAALLAAGAAADQERLEYLMWFDYDEAGQALLRAAETNAPTLRLRYVAQVRLANQPVHAAPAVAR